MAMSGVRFDRQRDVRRGIHPRDLEEGRGGLEEWPQKFNLAAGFEPTVECESEVKTPGFAGPGVSLGRALPMIDPIYSECSSG